MEHNFFVVGENRVLAFVLNNIKYILWFLIIIIAALSGVIAFLHYTGIQNQEQFKSVSYTHLTLPTNREV